jgi:hypothetical protein
MSSIEFVATETPSLLWRNSRSTSVNFHSISGERFQDYLMLASCSLYVLLKTTAWLEDDHEGGLAQ